MQRYWIKLHNSQNQAKYLGVAYRHPTNNTCGTLHHQFKWLYYQNNKKINILFVRNFNINIDPKASSYKSNNLVTSLISCNAFPLITLPTRITEHSQTIIDNIITNDTTNKLLPEIIRTDLSDQP